MQQEDYNYFQGLAPSVLADPRLAAGRGSDFSATAQRDKAKRDWEALLDEEDKFRIPIGVRIEDSLDTGGLQMASVHESIPESNKGYQMLQRMGWKGAGLGREETGILEPVKGGVEAGLRIGLGKQQQDDYYTAAENVQRRQLESEIQANEDEERTKRREEQVERDQRIHQDVLSIKRNLYCETCHKQYSSATEMEVHLSSYDHHHRKRLIEMRADEMERTKRERDRKERKRLDKEAARLHAQIQRAQQVNRAEQSPASLATPPPPPPPPDEPPPPVPDEPPPAPPPEASGWGHASGPALPQVAVQMNFGQKPAAASGRGSTAAGKPLGAFSGGAVKLKPSKLRVQPAVAAFQMDDDDDDDGT